MAELTEQGSIRLTHTNKFRISFHKNANSFCKERSFSKDRNNTNQKQNKLFNDNDKQIKAKARYPQSDRFKRELERIGVLQKDFLKFTFEPEEEQMKKFRTSRIRSLREKYLQKKFEFDNIITNTNPENIKNDSDQQIDDAVLGCWEYGKNTTRQRVWKQYKQNLNMLNFDVFKLVNKKRQRL